MANTILSGGSSILNAGGSLLEAGRRINRSGIGMSANSRALLEGFYDGATALFNQLYAKSEGAELANIVTIKALRSKYSYLVSDEVKANDAAEAAKAAAKQDTAETDTVPASSTAGTNVDTQA